MNNKIQIHGGNIHEEARRLGFNTSDLLDASASLVPFPLPKELHSCLSEALETHSIRDYPDRSHLRLRQDIGNHHGMDASMVMPGNGAAELFTWAAREAGEHGTSCLPSPGFSDYERSLRCWNAPFINIRLPLEWDKKSPQPFPIAPKTNVLWITNPHNPTGQLWSQSSIEDILNQYKLVICDEAFLPLVPNGEQQSAIPLIHTYKNLVVIRSLTKLFAIAGLRLGYALSSSNRLKKWQEWRDPWPLNSLAIDAGCMIMSNQEFLQKWTYKIHSWIKEEGLWLNSQLEKLQGITPHPSATNFQLIESQHSLIPLRKELEKRKILLRDCRSFKDLNDRWLRISLQTREDNKRIIKEICNINREGILKL